MGPVVITFYYPDYTVGSGITPDHVLQRFSALVGFTTDREFTACSVTLPRRFRYLVVCIITCLCFDDTVYGANFNALGGIKVTFAFDTGSCVNDIQSAIAFGDGIGGTFGQACAAGDAFF